MVETIITTHPAGKKGAKMDKDKYDLVKSRILAALTAVDELTLAEMVQHLRRTLGDFDGSIPWHTELVKLDLEARGIIKRIKKEDKTVYVLA